MKPCLFKLSCIICGVFLVAANDNTELRREKRFIKGTVSIVCTMMAKFMNGGCAGLNNPIIGQGPGVGCSLLGVPTMGFGTPPCLMAVTAAKLWCSTAAAQSGKISLHDYFCEKVRDIIGAKDKAKTGAKSSDGGSGGVSNFLRKLNPFSSGSSKDGKTKNAEGNNDTGGDKAAGNGTGGKAAGNGTGGKAAGNGTGGKAAGNGTGGKATGSANISGKAVGNSTAGDNDNAGGNSIAGGNPVGKSDADADAGGNGEDGGNTTGNGDGNAGGNGKASSGGLFSKMKSGLSSINPFG